MEEPSHEERFRDNVADLSDLVKELIAICYDRKETNVNPALVDMAKAVLQSYDPRELIEGFIKNTFKFWDEINQQSEIFFLENCGDIFKDLPVNDVDAFRILFEHKKNGNSAITTDDKTCIWNYFTSLVKICIKYIHKYRTPQIKTEINFFEDIPLHKYAIMFNVTLS